MSEPAIQPEEIEPIEPNEPQGRPPSRKEMWMVLFIIIALLALVVVQRGF